MKWTEFNVSSDVDMMAKGNVDTKYSLWDTYLQHTLVIHVYKYINIHKQCITNIFAVKRVKNLSSNQKIEKQEKSEEEEAEGGGKNNKVK